MLEKIKQTLKSQLTQGATAEKLSESITVGVLIGCFPLIGFTTGLAALFGYFLKLNHVVVQSVNYLLYPVQIILVPVYIKVISLIIDVGDVPIRPDLIVADFQADWIMFFKKYGLIAIYAVLLWSMMSLIIYFTLRKSFMPLLLKLKRP